MENPEQTEARLRAKLDEILGDNLDAKNFLIAYHTYTHRIDDIVDEKITDSEFLLKTFELASSIFSSNFWRQYGANLFLVEKLINNDYADSVLYENSTDPWKRHQADVLRHAGNKMVFAVIYLVKGYDALREVSSLIRENSYLHHHDEEGRAI